MSRASDNPDNPANPANPANPDDSGAIVRISDGEAAHMDETHFSCGSLLVYRQLLGNISYHTIHSMCIFVEISGRLGRLLRQVFLQLKSYELDPSLQIQKTWLPIPLLGITAMAAVIIKIADYRHLKKTKKELVAVAYLNAILSSSSGLFVLDFLSKNGNIGELPIGWFLFLMSMSMLFAAIFFLKLVQPDSSEQLIFSKETAAHLERSVILNAATKVRWINAFSACPSAATSFSLLFEGIVREVLNGTQPLFGWLKALIGLPVCVAAVIGYQQTTHPKRYNNFVALMNALERAAYTYITMSAIFFVYGVYECDSRVFCFDTPSRIFLTIACLTFTLSCGAFAGMTTLVRFSESYKETLALIGKIERTPGTMRDAKNTIITQVSQTTSTCAERVSNCFQFFVAKVSECRNPPASSSSSESLSRRLLSDP